MSRYPVHVREAVPADAGSLVSVWGDARRTSERQETPSAEVEAAHAVARIAADPDERLVVGTVDGMVVGAAHLVRTPLSPIHSESAVYVTHLYVLSQHRRHGVGKALFEAAVSWAEEKDTPHVLAAASANSREGNRFMARLGLTQLATVRAASVTALRGKLPVEPPAGAMVTSRNQRSVGQVLAQRRLQRRAQARVE